LSPISKGNLPADNFPYRPFIKLTAFLSASLPADDFLPPEAGEGTGSQRALGSSLRYEKRLLTKDKNWGIVGARDT
jgi:hypothetical protein